MSLWWRTKFGGLNLGYLSGSYTRRNLACLESKHQWFFKSTTAAQRNSLLKRWIYSKFVHRTNRLSDAAFSLPTCLTPRMGKVVSRDRGCIYPRLTGRSTICKAYGVRWWIDWLPSPKELGCVRGADVGLRFCYWTCSCNTRTRESYQELAQIGKSTNMVRKHHYNWWGC